MKRALISLAVFAGLVLFASPAWAQSEGEALREADGFSVDFAVASVGQDDFDDLRPAVGINPRWCWRQRRWCWWIDIWWVIGPRKDPWRGLLATDLGPLPVDQLELGDAVLFAPVLEYTFATDARLRPSIYAGFGGQYDQGATTRIGGFGDVRVESNTNPVAIYGFGLTYDINRRTSLRTTIGGATAFIDEMELTLPGNQRILVDGDDVSSSVVLVGLNVDF